MKILILGLSVTSSWGNGHATTYRALGKALHARGHHIIFVEKDVAWYRDRRNLPAPAFCDVRLYEDWEDEQWRTLQDAKDADVVVIGSYFPDAIVAADMLFERTNTPILFYDIDTPVSMAALRRDGTAEYLRADQVSHYAAYLSFSGGPVLRELELRYGARGAYPLYCSVDIEAHCETHIDARFDVDLSYLGTYADDRQAKLLALLNEPALQLPQQHFLVAGPLYPPTTWAANVRHIEHVPPDDHASFYSSSRYTLNLTRADMVKAGYSPSVRLFEAAACGAAIISDAWPGLQEFLEPGKEILLVNTTSEVVSILRELGDAQRREIGQQARERILAEHTSRHRAIQFEKILDAVSSNRSASKSMAGQSSSSNH